MKKFYFPLLIVLILLGSGLGLIFSNKFVEVKQNGNVLLSPAPINTPLQSPKLAETFEEPKMLYIPKISVQANMESVGMDDQGRMDVPRMVWNTAWYNLGAKPGERGSAVIAGHLDDITGAPAVFYNLNQLIEGDEVLITDKADKIQRFRVLRKEVYDFDKFPLQEVFDSKDRAYLNLITCDGSFDQASRNYSKRMVVYTERI